MNPKIETAGPSTALRSGRDDNFSSGSILLTKALFCNQIVIPTGAQRSGGTCCSQRFVRRSSV